MQLSIWAHCCFCHDDIINAIRTKNKINKLIKKLMNVEKTEDSLELMDELFKLEYCFCHDGIYNAIRAKNRIKRLAKTLMSLEKSEDSIKMMSKLFALEYEVSMLVIQCLKDGVDSSPESE